jgi:ABC-2 type transport system ATP-binding protein
MNGSEDFNPSDPFMKKAPVIESSAMAQIEVEKLTKTFQVAEGGFFSRQTKSVAALDGVSFSIGAGEIVGYIGPNGAGKSTTVKILAGILVPDAGRVVVAGRVPWKERVEHVRRLGVVFGQRTQLWWDLPLADSFDLLREIYRVPVVSFTKTRNTLIERLDIGGFLSTPVRQLSLGQRMRGELVASLLHSPEILFLDEPTIGLDAVSKLTVREFLKETNAERGVTVILTTHDMDDIEALCSRVLVIGGGKILSDGPLDTLRATVTRERWLTIDSGSPLPTIPGVTVISQEGERTTLAFDPQELSPAALIARLSESMEIRDLFVQDPPIEEIIRRFYTEKRP